MNPRTLVLLAAAGLLRCAAAPAPRAAADAAPPAAEPQVTIERVTREHDLAPGQSIRVENLYGDVRARFGGYEGHMEILANVQQLRADGVKLAVDVIPDPQGVRVVVRFPEGAPAPPQGDRTRADLAVLVPEEIALEAETSRGLLEVSGLKSDVVATTGAGKISIKKTAGRIEAHSESGPIQVSFDPATPGPPQVLESRVGDISIYLPETANAEVEAETSGDICTDFSLTIEHRLAEEPSKHATARVGEGGRRYLLRTRRGNVALHRIQKILQRADGLPGEPAEDTEDSDSD